MHGMPPARTCTCRPRIWSVHKPVVHVLQHELAQNKPQRLRWPSVARGWPADCGCAAALCRTRHQCGVCPYHAQATVSGALWRIVGTTLALWLPLVPLFLLVRHAISSRSPSRCAPPPRTPPRPSCSALQSRRAPCPCLRRDLQHLLRGVVQPQQGRALGGPPCLSPAFQPAVAAV